MSTRQIVFKKPLSLVSKLFPGTCILNGGRYQALLKVVFAEIGW